MLITVTFDIISGKTNNVILTGCDIDVEVTLEEYERISKSFETNLFSGMNEDKNLADICEKCCAEVNKWSDDSDNGDEKCRFDYPLEVRIDHAEHVWHAGFDELANDELIPPAAKLSKNADGTYTIRNPYED